VTRRIAAVAADPASQSLSITWANRARTVFDLRPLIRRRAVFAPLADPKLLAQARVIEDGLGVGWPGTEADIAADLLWYAAHPADNPFPDAIMAADEFRTWMARHGLSLATAAAALGLSRRQIAYYAGGERRIPRLVFLACMALDLARAGAPRRAA